MTVKIPTNPKNEGDLADHGYHLKKSAPARHRALNKAHKAGVPIHRILHELEALALKMRGPNAPASYEGRAWADYKWFEREHRIPKGR